jgi:tripartite-type tricarboxylate transporter receptor subunit TctC
LIILGQLCPAQNYPVKPIRLVVPYAPGGTPDIQGRLFAEKLRQRLGQPIVIDNRPGANASIGMGFVARAPADGYTLVIAPVGPWTVNPHLYDLPYDIFADFAPIIHATASPGVLALHPSVPATSVKELIALARRKPGALDYGSAGVGGFGHMCGELFTMMTNTRMTHVPFKSVAAAMIDTVAGRVPVSFNVAAVTIPHVQAGRLRALATTGGARMDTLPDLPTVAEAGVPGYENTTWIGIGAPARTPQSVIERLSGELQATLQLPDVRDALHSQGAAVTGWTGARFRDYLRVEYAKYGRIVKAARIKNE